MSGGRAGPQQRGTPLFIARGIPVEAHWSLPLITILIARAWALVLFPLRYPDLGGRAYALMTVGAVLSFWASILLHELGHAAQAVREGARVSHITLWFFGGVVWISGPRSPGPEARIVIAGPAVSAALAVAFGALALLAEMAAWSDALIGVPLLLAQINLLLLALNLLPILPLDGGRLLFAWLWHRRRDPASAGVTAARVGQVVAVATIAFGALAPFFGLLPGAFSPTAAVDGLSIMAFGAFGLWMAFAAEDAAAR